MGLWWQQLFLVMAGGAVGAASRFWLGGVLFRHLGDRIPWGTLAANLLGAFLVGFLAEMLEGRGQAALYWRAALIVGVIGGFTTFSALMLECLLLARSHRSDAMLAYLFATLAGGAVLVWLGTKAGLALNGMAGTH